MVQYKVGVIYKKAEKVIKYILKRYYKYKNCKINSLVKGY